MSVHRGVPGLKGGAWSRGVPGRGGCLVETLPDGYCCGRYASYWNAFLFNNLITRQIPLTHVCHDAEEDAYVQLNMVCLHWPRQRPRPMELGSMIMFGSVYTEPRSRPMQISIGSVYILLVSVSVSVLVSGSVNEL